MTASNALAPYDAAVAAHVIAVIAAFGVFFAYPWLAAGTASAHRARERILSVVVTPGATVALLIGLYLAGDRELLGESWVIGPLVIMVVLLGIVGAVLTPRERRLGGMDDDDPQRPALERQVRRAALACAALVAVAAFLMVTKIG